MNPRVVGAVVLLGLAALIVPATLRASGGATLVERLGDHALGAVREVEVRFAVASGLVAGDPVLAIGEERAAVVGEVRAATPAADGGEIVFLRLDPFYARRLPVDAVVYARHPGSNLGWALETLTPSPLRARVLRDLEAAWRRDGDRLVADAAPALRERLGDLASAAAAALPDAVERRRADWEPVARRLKTELYDAELGPAFDRELWPLVRAECGAATAATADELVRELGIGSVVRATWARTKDAVGLGDETAFAAEIDRLLQEKALPVLRRRAPELFDAGFRAASRATSAPALRAAVDRAVDRALADPEARRAAGAVLRDAFLVDPRVSDAWRALVADERLRRAAAGFARAAEPIFESALQEALLRDDGAGLDFRLVRVLRNVLLWKDRRYAAFEGAAGAAPAAPRATDPPTRLRGLR